jgi:DNA-binding NtrC family response regulator
MIAEETFRHDLFFRLRVGCVEMPPLRERGEDALRIADRFVRALTPAARLSREARARLLAHDWPGNVRELENVLAVAAAFAGGSPIAIDHLELPQAEAELSGNYHQQVEAFRRRLVAQALAECGGNQAGAAEKLGVSRQTVSYLVRQLGLGSKKISPGR